MKTLPDHLLEGYRARLGFENRDTIFLLHGGNLETAPHFGEGDSQDDWTRLCNYAEVSEEVCELIFAAAHSLPIDCRVSETSSIREQYLFALHSPIEIMENRFLGLIGIVPLEDGLFMTTSLFEKGTTEEGLIALKTGPGFERGFPIAYDEPMSKWTHNFNIQNADEGSSISANLCIRIFVALQAFILQKIALEERPTRAMRRRLEKSGAKQINKIHRIVLRRVEHVNGNGESTDTSWSHRWLVSGHWRNQYYPSTGEHQLIWISPHVKGPDDKPFVAKEKVFDVRR